MLQQPLEQRDEHVLSEGQPCGGIPLFIKNTPQLQLLIPFFVHAGERKKNQEQTIGKAFWIITNAQDLHPWYLSSVLIS